MTTTTIAPGSPFTEEHQALRASIRRWVDDELVPNIDQWEADELFPDSVFRRAGELGFLGLSMPTDVGGQGGDYWSTVVFLEEIARSCGSIGMALAVQTDMATPPIAQFGTPSQIENYLKPALAGEKIGAIGITEPDHGSDVAGITTRARKASGGWWVLNGSKIFITNGVRADFVTMVVRTGDKVDGDPWSGISLFIVDTDLEGFEVSKKLDKVGMRSSDTALLFMDDVHLPESALLGTEGEGFKQIMWELQGERLAAAILAVSGAQAAVDKSLQYAKDREAFGRPIGRFQAVKHRLAEMALDVEANRRLLYDCCDKWNRGVYATNEIAMVKLASAQMACRVADEAMQIHGGFGYSEEGGIERGWRDARIGRIGGGADEVQREIISKLMGL